MKKIKVSLLILVFTMLPVLLPDGIVSMLHIENRSMLLIRGLDLVILLFLMIKKNSKISFPFIMLSAIYCTIIFSAYIHGHNQLISFLSTNFNGLVMCASLEYWLNNYFEKTIIFLKNILFFLIVINLFMIVLFPNGLYAATYKFTQVTLTDHLTYNLNWLFGYKNNQFGIILPFLGIYCIYRICICNKFKNTSFIVFLVCILEEFLAKATMSLILITIFSFSVFLISQKNNKISSILSKFYNIKTIIVITIIIVISVIGLSSSSFIKNSLSQLSMALGKKATFNGRSSIWLVAINFIKKSPIIGYGNINSEIFIEQSRILGGTNAHNFILHVLISGGLLCLAEYTVLYWYIIRFLYNNKCIIASIMGIVIGLFFVDGITSICMYYPFFNGLFILAFYAVCFYCKKNGREIK